MPPSLPHPGARWAAPLCAALLGISACKSTPPAPVPPPPAPVAVEAPAPAAESTPAAPPMAPPAPDLADASDLAARRLLACNERLIRMAPPDLAAEIVRLGVQASSPGNPDASDSVLCLALALVQEHNPGDLARAANLLDPLVQPASLDPSPAQPLARLLAARIAEQKRLEDELDRQAAQRRDTQRAIQQLTEKLEALKAIERSMTARPPAAPASASEAAPTPPRTP